MQTIFKRAVLVFILLLFLLFNGLYNFGCLFRIFFLSFPSRARFLSRSLYFFHFLFLSLPIKLRVIFVPFVFANQKLVFDATHIIIDDNLHRLAYAIHTTWPSTTPQNINSAFIFLFFLAENKNDIR